MNKKYLRVKIKKFKPRKGDLFFISCDSLNSEDLEHLRAVIEQEFPDISMVITNYELKVQRSKVLDKPLLKIHCEGNFSYDSIRRVDELRHLEDAVLTEMQHAIDKPGKEKYRNKILLKSRYKLLKEQ